MTARLGIAGRLAAKFQANALTPLLALMAALLGLFAVIVTPREEEPQIDVTMATVQVLFPGASSRDVEQMIAVPAEQVLGQIAGLEHVWSASHPGMALITLQFKVGVKRETALTRLYDVVHSNQAWLPSNLGVSPPLVKAVGVDDVPIVAFTLWSPRADSSAYDLERIAHLLENDIKRVPGTRETRTLGGPGRVINVELDANKLAAAGLSISDLRYALQAANRNLPAGDLIRDNHALQIETGPFLDSAEAVAQLVVGVRNNLPVYLQQLAQISDGPATPQQYVWHWQRHIAAATDAQKNVRESAAPNTLEYPAVTLQVTKKSGENAVEVAANVIEHINRLRGVLIPDDVRLSVTRNYGETARDKASKLIEKLIFATLSVVALVMLALGRREAAIVGLAVLLTLTATLFASWAWGYTLNRVSLFALIFSIGILVDDAIVVVENIHRQRALHPAKSLRDLIPQAVDEVGGPTILATFTVIAALLPMAFVSGLMGPYMAPIPINASLGMLISLAIAFVLTPWLALRCLPKHEQHAPAQHFAQKLMRRWLTTLLQADEKSSRRRRRSAGFILALIAVSLALPMTQRVILKMLPFDNKSELQLMIDMPSGTALEHTSAVLHDIGAYLQTQSEVVSYQAYAGTSAPITFNGLVRQYQWRRASEQGDIQVNLLPKSQRTEKSHAIAQRLQKELLRIAQHHGADLKVIEVPPGPPVLSPIVAEVYGPDDEQRLALAKQVRAVFAQQDGLSSIDDSTVDPAPRLQLMVDRTKAALLGVDQQQIASTLRAALSGEDVSYLFDGVSKYPAPIRLLLPLETRSQLDALLQLSVRSYSGRAVPIRELVNVVSSEREQVRMHKDGLPLVYVLADQSGSNDSPLYGMFSVREKVLDLHPAGQQGLREYFVQQPAEAWSEYAIKWDGEWQITYETFRDMGAAYAVGLILIYLLVVAQFKSYRTPLIIMSPIPLTIIGVMPGHALLGAPFTATSMIGMIALAGIIVRNSILLVDFIELQLRDGVEFSEAIINSVATRAQPIVLTALAAMMGALFILDDPIFNGLAISLIFGVMVSTLLTLVVIPLLYYVSYRARHRPVA